MVLHCSLHALKDESYLRQTLQRQAAQLHQASIAYAVSICVLWEQNSGSFGINATEPIQ